MFNLGMGEITVILLLALIFLGPAKLPDLATGLGKLIREIRKATSDIKSEITLDETFRKPFEELRDAVTLHPDELKRRDQMKKMVDEARLRGEAEARETAAAAAAIAGAPASVEPEALASGAPVAPIDAQILPPIPPQFLTPVAPPAGTVARSRIVSPVDDAAGETSGPAAIMTSAPAPASSSSPVPEPVSSSSVPASSPVPVPVPEPVSSSSVPASSPVPVPVPEPVSSSSVPASSPLPGPRVTPPISSLSGDRANITQSLSEADLLPNTQPRRKRLTPPPLPGLDKTPSPPIGHIGPPRVTPPISSLSGDRANVTQALSESDLLPPAAPPLPADAVKPPPLPGSKKA